mmetsp:Transcript_140194/g.447373  ORF Transcript_140194/g.447373 Transcript_140194/m.447373 type:complete len:215 (-) Transcript_140194:97-741(-)
MSPRHELHRRRRRLPLLVLLLDAGAGAAAFGMPSAASGAAAADGGGAGSAGGRSLKDMVVGSEEQWEGAVMGMAEIMREAADEAAEEVLERAAAEGEDVAFQAAIKEAFTAFDADGDGSLSGEEVSVLLTVAGRTVPADLDTTPKRRYTFEDFEALYERSEEAEAPAAEAATPAGEPKFDYVDMEDLDGDSDGDGDEDGDGDTEAALRQLGQDL